MTKDSTDFVRQGALVSLAMILVQHSEAQTPKAKMARELFEKTVSDKHEDSLAKFGAAISQGIIDAGGRNVTISMQTKAGTPNMMAIVGMTLFSQFWYWFPLAHCLSLSFNPTGVIGLDESLKVGVTAQGGFRPNNKKADLVYTRYSYAIRYPSWTLSPTHDLPCLLTRRPTNRRRRRQWRKSRLLSFRLRLGPTPEQKLESRKRLLLTARRWRL
jgi:hypothetical protein